MAGETQKPLMPAMSENMKPAAWLDYLLGQAIESRASDVHIEPMRDKMVARFRIDGMLRVATVLPLASNEIVISRLKVLAQLNIAEHRRPQEGHISVTHPSDASTQIDLRVSILPTLFGESAVVRILNRNDLVFDDIAKLGMNPEDISRFQEVIQWPYGMILVTGPVGSGKTTTLYTALNAIRSLERNVITLEDPVEYQLESVRQSQVQPDLGFTFASGLRAILRQDPDVVLIGEIRDQETAEISVRAALSGRLFFSTLHTNDAIGAIARFLEFGIPRSFIASALQLVVAQRLLRRVCDQCAAPDAPPPQLIQDAGIAAVTADMRFLRGRGCSACFQSGYRGRFAIFEMLYLDEEIEDLILSGAPFPQIRDSARRKGMRNLREEAIRRALEGATTLEEAIHTTAA